MKEKPKEEGKRSRGGSILPFSLATLFLLSLFGNGCAMSRSAWSKSALAMLLVVMVIFMGLREGRTDTNMGPKWQEHVRKLRAKGEDVKIMRSKNMTPEKSPQEFLKRYKKVRKQAGDNFTLQTFVEDVARGLVIEQQYDEYDGVFYIKKENRNPNYYWGADNKWMVSQERIFFNCNKFCITPDLLRNVFGKEDRIETYLTEKTKSYRYYSMGMNFEVDFISGINKTCATKARFDSTFFLKMEKR